MTVPAPDAAAPRPGRNARSAGRALAIQWLYAWEQNRYQDDGHLVTAEALDDAGEAGTAFAAELEPGVVANRTPIDAAIDQRLQNWTIHRLSVIDRQILRLGAYEILYREDVPPRVAINEAVELAKQFGSEDKTPRLVNGVLDRLARDHRPEAFAGKAKDGGAA
ncbi:MAG: transcription antitermination factor NusB [Planctomycetes bacterium]|nr:transcription antitermination factor NusB [Planctomycetota bacterium]